MMPIPESCHHCHHVVDECVCPKDCKHPDLRLFFDGYSERPGVRCKLCGWCRPLTAYEKKEMEKVTIYIFKNIHNTIE